MGVTFALLRVPVRQAGEPPHVHLHRESLAFHGLSFSSLNLANHPSDQRQSKFPACLQDPRGVQNF